MQQHDGGDRAEYLQEMGHSDPWFYVPPINDASMSTPNNVPANYQHELKIILAFYG